MTRNERKEFRTVAREAMRRLRAEKKITWLQRGRGLIALLSDKNVEEAADMCAAQAVACGLARDYGEVNLSKIVGEIDIEKLMEFFLMILPMFL